MAIGKSVLVDVRTDEEWQAGKAKGAIHFELRRLQNGEMPEIAEFTFTVNRECARKLHNRF